MQKLSINVDCNKNNYFEIEVEYIIFYPEEKTNLARRNKKEKKMKQEDAIGCSK